VKIKVEKVPGGVRLTVTLPGQKQPAVVELDDAKCVVLTGLVEAARKAAAFTFEAEW
jgi:hypothetical protein